MFPVNYSPYLVGNRVYGGGSYAPNIGPVDPSGYRTRDLMAKARRNAMLRKLKAQVSGDYMSADYLRNMQ